MTLGKKVGCIYVARFLSAMVIESSFRSETESWSIERILYHAYTERNATSRFGRCFADEISGLGYEIPDKA